MGDMAALSIPKCCICCKTENSKYKCPNCFSSYCSLKCCQDHKITCLGRVTKPIIPNLIVSEAIPLERDSGDPYERMKKLIKSANLQKWIKKLDFCSVHEASYLYDRAMEDREFLEYAQLIGKLRKGDSISSEEEQ